MVEDQGKQKEGKFDFTSEGEALGYISMDQARVMAMRTASETPAAYRFPYHDGPGGHLASGAPEAEQKQG